MKNNIGSFLAKRAKLSPHREAYVDGTRAYRLTFEELNTRCNRLANAWLAAGVQPGERVGLMLMNSAEFMEAYFALAKIGAVIVPLNWRLVANELEFILKDSGTRRLLFGEEFLETVGDLHDRGDRTDVEQWLQVGDAEPVATFAGSYEPFRDAGSSVEPTIAACDDDMLYIMYTSGTTGLPKGVVHTHTTAMWGVLTIAATTYFREHERYLSCLPMFHVGALTPITLNVYRGATSIVMRTFDPLRAWQLIETERITCGLAVPAMLNFMLQVGDLGRFDYSSLRWCLSGAAPVPEPLIEAYAALGIEIHQIYGLTESCGPACLIDAEHALKKIGSTGKAFFHTDIRVVNEAGVDCQPGEPGEVLVRGAHVMREYWNRPEATAQTIVDGWLHTGDVARMDADGYIFIQDRIKDMIISGGENIYPAEIENILMAHDGIAEAAVIGQPSQKWGESPFAVVVRKDVALAERDVIEFCRGRLAGYKLPRGVAFVSEIPRNPSGKILKRILREQFPRVPRPCEETMELDELSARLVPFCQENYSDPAVRVFDVHKMPGHAGFAYGFSVASGNKVESWFIRLPPPNVQWRGTADVLRQVEVLNALEGTPVPHCSVRWSGDDTRWFGCPYFVVPKLSGDVLRLGPGEWGAALSRGTLEELGRQAMTALAQIHKLDWHKTPYLGAPIPFEDDVTRWDRFYERAADPERLALVPEVRRRLLARLPADAPIGVFHGDFQTANLFCSSAGTLLAVIDWELTGIGATLNDVGWIVTFSDPDAWHRGAGQRPTFLDPETLIAMYRDAWGKPLPDVNWFRALAAYKFAIITGFNLSLHRRGKRDDPLWEVTKLSMEPLVTRALALLQ